MLSDPITLAVDEDNNTGTAAVNHVYSRYDQFQNRSEYIHSSHTSAAKDKMTVYRTLPKVSGNFRGVAKSAIKFTKDVSVAGVDSTTTLVAQELLEINCSFPVGTTVAQQKVLRYRAAAALMNDTLMDNINFVQMI